MHNREKKKLEDIVQNTIIKYHLIENEDKIVVGVSGGPDSMCLLDNLVKMRLKLEKRGNLYLNRELFEGKSQLNSEMIKGNPQSNLGNQLGKISPIKLRKPVGTWKLEKIILKNYEWNRIRKAYILQLAADFYIK